LASNDGIKSLIEREITLQLQGMIFLPCVKKHKYNFTIKVCKIFLADVPL
jgi:hypothetical protein